MDILIIGTIIVLVGIAVGFYIKSRNGSGNSGGKGKEIPAPYEAFLKTLYDVFYTGKKENQKLFLEHHDAEIKAYMKYPDFIKRYNKIILDLGK